MFFRQWRWSSNLHLAASCQHIILSFLRQPLHKLCWLPIQQRYVNLGFRHCIDSSFYFIFFFNCTCFRFTICLGRGNLLILCGRCARQYAFDMTDEPLHLNISIHTILLTPPYTFLEMLTRRICLSINSFLEVKRLTMWPMQKAEYDGKMFWKVDYFSFGENIFFHLW